MEDCRGHCSYAESVISRDDDAVMADIADGVCARQGEFCRSNAIVVRGEDGVLLVDAGVDGPDLEGLADDIGALGCRWRPVCRPTRTGITCCVATGLHRSTAATT